MVNTSKQTHVVGSIYCWKGAFKPGKIVVIATRDEVVVSAAAQQIVFADIFYSCNVVVRRGKQVSVLSQGSSLALEEAGSIGGSGCRCANLSLAWSSKLGRLNARICCNDG